MKIFVSFTFAAFMASLPTSSHAQTGPYGIDIRDWCRINTHSCADAEGNYINCNGCKDESSCCACLSQNCGLQQLFTCTPQTNSVLMGLDDSDAGNPITPEEAAVVPNTWVCPLDTIQTYQPLSNDAKCKLYTSDFCPRCADCKDFKSCCGCFETRCPSSYAFQCTFGYQVNKNNFACIHPNPKRRSPNDPGLRDHNRAPNSPTVRVIVTPQPTTSPPSAQPVKVINPKRKSPRPNRNLV